MSKNGKAPTSAEGAAERSVTIRNKYGIHARPAALFVKTAAKFDAEIMVFRGDMAVSGKSIMGLLTLEGYQGSVLRLVAEGADAVDALDALEKLINQKFFEE